MIRKIIKINEEKCNGCGVCASACHEGAIEIIDGKAKLTRENYCDGLGDCLPRCPADAISFEEREAPAYDEEAVKASKREKILSRLSASGCESCADGKKSGVPLNWPIQIKLAPPEHEVYNNADLLIAASCSGFMEPSFSREYINGHAVLIGCPKLDGVDYSEKLAEIISRNDFRSLTLARMQVPCCGGLELAVKKAVLASGRVIPLRVVTIENP